MNTPLQKLYEKVYFDNYNLSEALQGFDVYQDGTVAMKDFRVTIMREVPSIDSTQEIDLLT